MLKGRIDRVNRAKKELKKTKCFPGWELRMEGGTDKLG